MKPYEFIGYTLINTTAVSAIVGAGSAATVYHGLRPVTTTLPAINYYQIGGGTKRNGFEVESYSINCRARTAAAARDLAREVIEVFNGSSGTGTYGTENSFDVARAALRADNGLIPEPEDDVFNAPVDVTIVYAINTVS